MVYKIGIIATEATHNLGDFLRGQATIDLVRKVVPDAVITVFSYEKPDYRGMSVWQHFSEIHHQIRCKTMPIQHSLNYYRALKDQDVVVISDGSLHGYSRKAVIPSFIGTELSIIMSKLFGHEKKLIALGITYVPGPSWPSDVLNDLLLKNCISAVSTRDYESYKYLHSLSIKNVLLATDLVFNINELNRDETTIAEANSDLFNIGVNLRPLTYGDNSKLLYMIGRTIKLIFKELGEKVEFLLLPLSYDDYKMALELIELLPQNIVKNAKLFDIDSVNMAYVYKLINNMNKLDVAFGMGLHFGILSLICKKPLVPICYHPKVKSLAEEFGLDYSIELGDLNSVNPENMSHLVMEASHYRAMHLVEEKLQAMRERAICNLRLLEEFIVN